MCGYDHFRITELLYPLVDKDKDLTLSIFFKRALRILQSKPRHVDDNPPGTFLVHAMDINYGKNEDHLIIIVELHTGWVNAVVTEAMRCKTIVSTLYKMCNEIGMIFKVEKSTSRNPINKSLRKESELKKIPLKQIVIPTYIRMPVKKKKGASTIEQPTEMSYVTKMPAVKQIEALNKTMKPYDRNKIVSKEISGNVKKERLIIEGDYTRTELNKRINEILYEYNRIDREKSRFPRTKETVTPKIRLFEALIAQWEKNPKQKRIKPVFI